MWATREPAQEDVPETQRRRRHEVTHDTYIKAGGEWKYLYRAVEKAGDAVEFLLSAMFDRTATQRFPDWTIAGSGPPQTDTIDQSGADTARIEDYTVEHDTTMRAVKRITRRMIEFKSFRCVRVILGGIEMMHMSRKVQLRSNDGGSLSAARQFYSLAATYLREEASAPQLRGPFLRSDTVTRQNLARVRYEAQGSLIARRRPGSRRLRELLLRTRPRLFQSAGASTR